MAKPTETRDWHKFSRLPYRVELPATSDTGLLHAWALKRCGHGGYAETSEGRPGDREIGVAVVQFSFPTAEIARDFAAAFAQIGAKVV